MDALRVKTSGLIARQPDGVDAGTPENNMFKDKIIGGDSALVIYCYEGNSRKYVKSQRTK
jgi:hypothetical protein